MVFFSTLLLDTIFSHEEETITFFRSYDVGHLYVYIFYLYLVSIIPKL